MSLKVKVLSQPQSLKQRMSDEASVNRTGEGESEEGQEDRRDIIVEDYLIH